MYSTILLLAIGATHVAALPTLNARQENDTSVTSRSILLQLTIPNDPSNSTLTRRGLVNLDPDQGGHVYATVSVGNNLKDFTFVVDTGSSITWVPVSHATLHPGRFMLIRFLTG
jgi:predicted aspartyl protease